MTYRNWFALYDSPCAAPTNRKHRRRPSFLGHHITSALARQLPSTLSSSRCNMSLPLAPQLYPRASPGLRLLPLIHVDVLLEPLGHRRRGGRGVPARVLLHVARLQRDLAAPHAVRLHRLCTEGERTGVRMEGRTGGRTRGPCPRTPALHAGFVSHVRYATRSATCAGTHLLDTQVIGRDDGLLHPAAVVAHQAPEGRGTCGAVRQPSIRVHQQKHARAVVCRPRQHCVLPVLPLPLRLLSLQPTHAPF